MCTERLVDRQVGLDDEHRRAGHLRLFEDMTATTIEHAVDTTDRRLWALNFHEVDCRVVNVIR